MIGTDCPGCNHAHSATGSDLVGCNSARNFYSHVYVRVIWPDLTDRIIDSSSLF